MAVTIQKIIGSSDGNPDNGLTARNKINSNFKNLVDAILSIQVEAGTTSFENLTNKPSTLQGYGITDAVNSTIYSTHVASNLHLTDTQRSVLSILSVVDGKLKIDADAYSTGELSAYGVGTGGGGGAGLIQSVYGSSGLGGTYLDSDLTNSFNAYTVNLINSNLNSAISRISTLEGGSGGSGLIQTVYGYNNLGGAFFDYSNLTDTFNAYTINQLASRITTLEGGTSSNISISTIGTGNAITTATKSGDVITFAKDSTFVLTNDYRLTNARYNPYAITFTGYTSAIYDGSNSVTIPIPNNTSQLTNGAGYITSAGSISGNAGTASTLQNSRTLWGQSFNGSANVTGSLSSVTDLTMSGTLSVGSAQLIYDSTTNTLRVQKSDGSSIGFYSTGEVSSYGVGSNNGTAYISKALSLSSTLTTASDIYSGANIHLNNEFYIKCKNSSGTYYKLFGVDSGNYVKFGDIALTSIFKGAGVLMSTASKTNIVTLYDTISLNANTAVTGTITSTGSGTFTGGSFSSLRELKDIHNDWEGSALDEIAKFKVRSFNYKNQLNHSRTLGFIVDEIPESMSDYVLANKAKNAINLYTLHALAFLGLQETKSEVDKLKEKIISLENEIDYLKIKLN